ncbi:MAG: aspartate--tRNA ligase [Mycoplasmataceae bacterium]|nr:aspartate--tRNA ligase [Mycoplasmataceae bacterium]
MKRTIINDLSIKNKGESVSVSGWVQKSRRMGSLIFVDVRDVTGIVQLVFSDKGELFKKAESLRNEFVIQSTGKVVERKSKNKNIKTGDIEIICDSLNILSKSSRLPMLIQDDTDALENVRMNYRYLDLRRPVMRDRIIARSNFNKITHDYFNENGFINIETPILTKPTPEGARDFLVPSRVVPGSFFSLPQSPQLYKQLLMISGFDKYYQIAKVFRDEDSRKDRQVEFTQLDIEMSFMSIDEIMNTLEEYVKLVFRKLDNFSGSEKFERISYDNAMNTYGSDRPDTRFNLLLNDGVELFKDIDVNFIKDSISKKKTIKYIKLDKKLSGKDHKELESFVKSHGANGLLFYSFDSSTKNYSGFLSKHITQNEKAYKKFKSNFGENNDYSFLAIIGDWKQTCEQLGSLRLELSNRYLTVDNSLRNFIWVTDWPLFEYDKETKLFSSVHHPFTKPTSETAQYLDTDPAKVRSLAYDIVLNGSEIGGGSLRIHDKEMQYKVFEILGLSKNEIKEKFSFFIDAFEFGVPPHGGIAFGVDRIMQIITDSSSIRDVIAFPKSTSGVAEMEKAPSNMPADLLNDLSIIIKDNVKG